MTRYGISEEGAAAMELLGEKLRNAANGIGTQSSNLNNKVTALSSGGRLGIFGDEIKRLTTGNSMAVQRANEDIGLISQKTKSIAGKIRELVCAGLGGTAVLGGRVSAKTGNAANPETAAFNDTKTPITPEVVKPNNVGSNPIKPEINPNNGVKNPIKPEVVNPNKGEKNHLNLINDRDWLVKPKDLKAYIEPKTGVIPRTLEKTRFSFNATWYDNSFVYDSPEETHKYLIQKQGRAYPDKYLGTCGLCSCANIVLMAGVEVSEKDVIDYATNTKTMQPIIKKGVKTDEKEIFLCTNDSTPKYNGGTTAYQRQEILKHFGIESTIKKIKYKDDDKTIDYEMMKKDIADYVSDGRGVILSVHANALWKRKGDPKEPDNHAVVVTSVRKDDMLKEVLEFYISDTGSGKGGWYSAKEIVESLTGVGMNVTNKAIR